jgi:hypothetical protein
MQTLRKQLDELVAKLPDGKAVRARIDEIYSVYPFNEFEYLISTLLGRDVLSLDQYYEMRDSYLERNAFLYIFEISAPRTFGEAWAQGHLKELVPDLSKPSKKFDPNYSGQYDFLLDGRIRIEVKASRAVDTSSDEPLYVKALSSESTQPFWILSSHELKTHRAYSKGQHRGNTGEGQLHLRQENIRDFDKYEVVSSRLGKAIRDAYKRQLRVRNH